MQRALFGQVLERERWLVTPALSSIIPETYDRNTEPREQVRLRRYLELPRIVLGRDAERSVCPGIRRPAQDCVRHSNAAQGDPTTCSRPNG